MDIDTSQTNAGAVDELTAMQALLVNSKMRLFKSSLVPDVDTPQADYIAAEADFIGYAAKTVAAWAGPALSSTGEFTISTPAEMFVDTDGTLPNSIGGAWIETAGGSVQEFIVFPVPVVLSGALEFISLTWYIQRVGPGFVAVET